ncbi:MAG: ABC transporter substrate-binding protein, partial [Aeromicrobium sp.]|nr:ABC transporter substrate-binding protein [Burkholderiales bacterium]
MTTVFHCSARKVLLTTVASLVLLALPMKSSIAQTKGREVSIGLQAAITSMDPHYHNVGPNNSLVRHVFESLVHIDDNQKLVPGLATSWKALDDLTWEFKLRKNVRFHDGSPFTAEDVAFTIKRAPNVPNSPSSFATFTRSIVDVKVVDPHTVVIKTGAA